MKRLLIPIIVLTALAPIFLAAQELPNPLEPEAKSQKMYIGPVFGYNRSMHMAQLPSFADDELCPYFENGDGNGFFAGGTIEFFIGDVKNSKHSIIGRVIYSTMPAHFETEGKPYPSLVEVSENNFQRIETSTQHKIDVTYAVASVEAMYSFKLFGGFALTAGPTVDIPISKSFEQRYELIGADNVQFKPDDEAETKGYRYVDNNRAIIVKDDEIEDAAGVRVALKAGAQYYINTGSSMYIVPGVFYNFGISNVSGAVDWRADAFQIGVDIRFAI